MLKSVEPALRALMAMEDFAVDGFLCPGHVATIIGEEGFRFMPQEYRMPGVIGGFEPEEILTAVYLLLKQISLSEARIENAYPRAVHPEGNPIARNMLRQYFRTFSSLFKRRAHSEIISSKSRYPFSLR